MINDSLEIHTINMVESLAEQAKWEFNRLSENLIAVAVEGTWRKYSLHLDWSDRDDTLRLICSFKLTPPEDRAAKLLELMNLVNDKLRFGNFVLWPEHKQMAFRYGLTLVGGANATSEQIETMMRTAVDYADRFYPAFQLVSWSDQTPEQALSVAIDEAYGTA